MKPAWTSADDAYITGLAEASVTSFEYIQQLEAELKLARLSADVARAAASIHIAEANRWRAIATNAIRHAKLATKDR